MGTSGSLDNRPPESEGVKEVNGLDHADQADAITTLSPTTNGHPKLSSFGPPDDTPHGVIGGTPASQANISSGLPDPETVVDQTPSVSEPSPAELCSLGIADMNRFDQSGEKSDIDEAISKHREAARLTPSADPNLRTVMCTLGLLLLRRYVKFHDVDDFNEALAKENEAVQMSAGDPLSSLAALGSLIHVLSCGVQQHGGMRYVTESINALRQLVGLMPPDQPGLPSHLSSLGLMLFRRFEHQKVAKDLDEAITIQRQVVQILSSDSPGYSTQLIYLTASLKSRFEHFGLVDDIQEAVQHAREAVKITPTSDPLRASVLGLLAVALTRRFERLEEMQDIDDAIAFSRECIAPLQPGSPALSIYKTMFGNSLMSRYERLGNVADIDEAIKCEREAVDLTTASGPTRFAGLHVLGNSLMMRFQRQGTGVEDIDEAIKLQRQAVELIPPDSSFAMKCKINIGLALFSRFERFGNVADINEAINVQQDVLQLIPQDNPDSSLNHSNLAGAYLRRFQRFGTIDDLEKAITTMRKALSHVVLGDAHASRRSLCNLATILMDRFDAYGEIKDVDEAIQRFCEAESLFPPGSSERLTHLENTGLALLRRFGRFGEKKDIDKSIQLYRDAVRLASQDKTIPSSGFKYGLGLSLMARSRRFEEIADMNEAIKYQREAIQLMPTNPVMSAIYRVRLAESLNDRFNRFGNLKDIDEAIELQREAAKLTPRDSPYSYICLVELGTSFMHRFQQSRRMEDIDEAINHQREAIQIAPVKSSVSYKSFQGLGDSCSLRFKQTKVPADLKEAIQSYNSATDSQTIPPRSHLQVLSSLARMAFEAGELDVAFDAYTKAVNVLPIVAWIGLDVDAQLRQLSMNLESRTLVCDTVACAIQLAERYPNREQDLLSKGVALLDQGRSIMWSQASNLQAELKALGDVNPSLAEEVDRYASRLKQASFRDFTLEKSTEQYFTLATAPQALNDPQALTQLSTTLELQAQADRRTAEKYSQLVEEVRKLTGFERFLRPLLMDDLRRAATNGPIVIVNVSSFRCDIVVVEHKKELALIPLPDRTAAEAAGLAEEYANQVSAIESGQGADGLNSILHKTWSMFGQRVVNHFGFKSQLPLPRIWWCLTGSSTFIPIHACLPNPGKGRKRSTTPLGMMDLAISSYTPTLSSLLRAQRSEVSSSLHMLAVAQSKDVCGAPGLQSATEEMQILRKFIGSNPSTVVEDDAATVDSVAKGLNNCTWAHFACHAVQNANEPTKSALLMHDGPLTLSRIARSSILSRIVRPSLPSAQFAYLSACQSAKGSKDLPNESIHIAAGLQFAGFRSVVGTMWKIRDEDSAYVAEKFYENILRKDSQSLDASDASRALHQAVQQLRKDRQASATRWVPFIHLGI